MANIYYITPWGTIQIKCFLLGKNTGECENHVFLAVERNTVRIL